MFYLDDKLRSYVSNSVTSAKSLDSVAGTVFYEIITNLIIHGRLRNTKRLSPHIKYRKCCERFPRDLLNLNQSDRDDYRPHHRLSYEDGGYEATMILHDNKTVTADNGWALPHNHLLCKIFNAHINVEYWNDVKSIKYIREYVNKKKWQSCHHYWEECPCWC